MFKARIILPLALILVITVGCGKKNAAPAKGAPAAPPVAAKKDPAPVTPVVTPPVVDTKPKASSVEEWMNALTPLKDAGGVDALYSDKEVEVEAEKLHLEGFNVGEYKKIFSLLKAIPAIDENLEPKLAYTDVQAMRQTLALCKEMAADKFLEVHKEARTWFPQQDSLPHSTEKSFILNVAAIAEHQHDLEDVKNGLTLLLGAAPTPSPDYTPFFSAAIILQRLTFEEVDATFDYVESLVSDSGESLFPVGSLQSNATLLCEIESPLDEVKPVLEWLLSLKNVDGTRPALDHAKIAKTLFNGHTFTFEKLKKDYESILKTKRARGLAARALQKALGHQRINLKLQ